MTEPLLSGWGDRKQRRGDVILVISEAKASRLREKATMGQFLRYCALSTHQDFRLSAHDVTRLYPSETERHRSVKNQAKALLLVNRRGGRYEIRWGVACRILTGRADQQVSCGTNL